MLEIMLYCTVHYYAQIMIFVYAPVHMFCYIALVCTMNLTSKDLKSMLQLYTCFIFTYKSTNLLDPIRKISLLVLQLFY